MSEVKFTEDEIKKLKELQKNYIDVQRALGQLSVTELRLNSQLNAIDESKEKLSKSFYDNQNSERDFIDEITKKYGNGTLDLETGTFISEKSDNKK